LARALIGEAKNTAFNWGGKEWLMATFREEQARSGSHRTRWIVIGAIAVAVVVAVVLVILYSGGGSSGGGGGGY
jgi:hypothetical protein